MIKTLIPQQNSTTISKPSPSAGGPFKGFLIGAYNSIVKNSKSAKKTRYLLIFYLLVLVIIPPAVIMVAFFTKPTQTARSFNFAMRSIKDTEPQVLGVNTYSTSQGNGLLAYATAVLEPQAVATVKALRAISPKVVAGIVLPEEKDMESQTTQPIAAAVGPLGSLEFKDTAGHAVIKAGNREVSVIFDKEYATKPVVTAIPNLVDDVNMDEIPSYAIYNLSTKGFEIKMSEETTFDLDFSWIALSGQGD
ncbi:MAG: hypothetical protein WAX66_03600 [Patescibacteria group bacterium]